MIKKIIEKLKSGFLRDIIHESKWIYSYTSQYKYSILLYIFLGVAGTLIGLGSSVVSKYLIDVVTSHNDSRIVPVAALFILLSLLGIAFSAISSRIDAKIRIKAANEIRADIFSRFLDIDWQASLDYHSGDLLSRVNRDVETVSNSVLDWIPSLVITLVQFLGILLILLFYDPVMALLTLVGTPVSVLLGRALLEKMRSFGKQVREADANLISFYEESLGSLQSIKAFNLHERFNGRLLSLQDIYRNISLDYNLFSVKTRALLSFVAFFTGTLTFAWAIYRLWTGYISFGSLVLFLRLSSSLSSAFSSLVNLIPSAVNATVSAGRIMAILELPMENGEISEEAEAVIKNARTDGVSVIIDEAYFSYEDGREIFRGLNLSASPGEIIGVVSPSGIGKTTLIRMLLGLITPSKGNVIFTSGDASAELSPCLRCLISYVAQEKIVFSGTIADSLRLCRPDADDAELEAALRAACAWDFVSELPQGINTMLKERGAGLSEGQLQRLSIARAVLNPAPVMLLDEATSALDITTEKMVIRNILTDNPYRTVIVTSHRPTVLSICTRVCSLENGTAVILSEEQISTYGRD